MTYFWYQSDNGKTICESCYHEAATLKTYEEFESTEDPRRYCRLCNHDIEEGNEDGE